MVRQFIVAGTVLLLFSCGSGETGQAAATDSAVCAALQPLNPNGDSELALLMREMVNTTQGIKDSLEKKAALPAYPEHFGKIFFAKKTDTTLNKDLFNGLADNYIRSLKYFYGAGEKEKIKAYNGMVSACVTCHENFCGGPLKRIKKFILPE